MDVVALFHRFSSTDIRRLLLIIGTVVIAMVVFQCFALPYSRSLSLFEKGSRVVLVYANSTINTSKPTRIDAANAEAKNTWTEIHALKTEHSSTGEEDTATINDSKATIPVIDIENSTEGMGNLNFSAKSITNAQPNNTKTLEIKPTLLSEMNSLMLLSLASSSSNSPRPRWSSVRDSELLSAKLDIQQAPILRDIPDDYGSIFRNVSMFQRSYELMERIFKVYIYKEGKKPLFHQSKTRGIYASEGWFMKLIEGNRKFTVKNPKKAHLYYLPFSSYMLRTSPLTQDLQSQKDMEKYLKKYIDLISAKYSFWNRSDGADHFLVGCHDWAPRITLKYMKNCIRSLCNANIARGFKVSKDTTLPVTYIRSANAPLDDIGGNPPSERSILAFFAGSMHGYLRPTLLKYWENKEADMKIFGPLPRDVKGKQIYRNYMKNSKYCICARGYEVHTPRVVEAISHECIPVIISDNYVPPFFEILKWEMFSVFVEERDIPNLRNILLSIPEEKYKSMHLRVKLVQRHFLWHKKPVKYDLFHMILHSVWYNRVFQVRTR